MAFECWLHVFRGSFGSFSSAVDVRTKKNLYGVRVLASCISRLVWLGSRCKNEEELVWRLNVGFMYFTARLARVARQWM